MIITDNSNRSDLEMALLLEPSLYASLDEQRLLSGSYSDQELRDAIAEWVEAGNEAT